MNKYGDCWLMFHKNINLYEAHITENGLTRRCDYTSIGEMVEYMKNLYKMTDVMIFDIIHNAKVID